MLGAPGHRGRATCCRHPAGRGGDHPKFGSRSEWARSNCRQDAGGTLLEHHDEKMLQVMIDKARKRHPLRRRQMANPDYVAPTMQPLKHRTVPPVAPPRTRCSNGTRNSAPDAEPSPARDRDRHLSPGGWRGTPRARHSMGRDDLLKGRARHRVGRECHRLTRLRRDRPRDRRCRFGARGGEFGDRRYRPGGGR